MNAFAVGFLSGGLALACARMTWRIATMRITHRDITSERQRRNIATVFKYMARKTADRTAAQEAGKP